MGGRNRYLVTPSGRYVGTRNVATLLVVGMLVGPIVLAVAGALLGQLVGPSALALGILAGLAVFIGGTVLMWRFLLRGSKQIGQAASAWYGGDVATAVPLCHRPLLTVFRADVRAKALHVLGLCAEANADFAEAEELFRMACVSVPAMAAPTKKRHAQVLMTSHRAIALVALGRLQEADMAIRQASSMYPQMNRPGVLDAFTDDSTWGIGAVSMNGTLVTIEPGRDPRAMLTLATVVMLAATQRGREAIDVLERERALVARGLLPREQALLWLAESRARAQLGGGGPMREAALATSSPWADRVLAARA